MKRGRPVSQDAKGTSPKQCRVIEEIVHVTETRPVLVRLPFLDYFRNAHLCERATSEQEQRDGPTEFAPDALKFVPGTIETDHPKVLIHTREHGALEFEGAWCEARGIGTAAPRSNRVIVELTERTRPNAAIGISAAGHTNTNTNTNTNSGNGSVSGSGEVASLLKHPTVGVTADEARGRERARNASWIYRRMDVPCATLVLRRVR